MGECLRYLAHGARWIMIAALGGVHTDLDLKNVYVRNVRVIGSTLRSRTPAMKAEILGKLVSEVFEKVEKGVLRPTIYKVLPVTEAETAHALLATGESVGKVVLEICPM
jgi:NADPH:quinone reductase-like Zn-dependent oxidoreductase